MPPAVISQQIHSSFKVCYKACHNCAGYEVAWNAFNKKRFMRPIANREANCEIITSLVPGTLYNVCVRADNQCGETCTPKRMTPPPRPPTCHVGVCTPIPLTCTCDETGDSIVKSYQI